MTDYSVLSDISINAMVSRKLYGEPSHEHRLELVNQVVDYCNKPDDAMPIIIENGISLECIIVNRHEKTWRAQFKSAYVKHHINHKNPLRATMIVFLQMQENNHD